MGWFKTGRATIDPNSPRSLGICDRCGCMQNLNKLIFQQEYRGNILARTGFRVCETCLDTPTQQFRPLFIPADPLPVYQPRTEPYLQDESAGNIAVANSGMSVDE